MNKFSPEQPLPAGIVGQSDVKRLLRELENYEETAHQRSLTKNRGIKSRPRYHSQLLQEVAADFSLKIDRQNDRKTLISFLNNIKSSSPTLNVYFATEPTNSAVQQLISWFRTEIHPATLLEIHIRPSILGGCIIRSSNKVFDYSHAAKSEEADKILSKKLKSLAKQL